MSASSQLSLIAGQFDTIDNRAEWIATAETLVNRDLFETRADLAVAYMTAHLITVNISQGGAGGGEISSKREGDLSISYAVSSNGGNNLNSTGFGKQFIMLSKSTTVFVGVTNGVSLYG